VHSTSAVADFATCPHDRGPGTITCLRCRADSHRAAAASRRRTALHAGAGVACVAAVLAIGSSALVSRGDATTAPGPAAAGGGRLQLHAAPAATAPEAPAAPAAAPATPGVVDAGRTDLGDGLFAQRTGDEVVVHFDTPVWRTRRAEKFEVVVRETLGAVYGPAAQHALDAVPEGALITGDGLLTDLPQHGIALPARDGVAITIYPETRPGQDGPLAVRYRIAASAAR
jgi:hypothetical protein